MKLFFIYMMGFWQVMTLFFLMTGKPLSALVTVALAIALAASAQRITKE